jgi:hypothetical protein
MRVFRFCPYSVQKTLKLAVVLLFANDGLLAWKMVKVAA